MSKEQQVSEAPDLTWRSDAAHEAICEAAEAIANRYCSEDDTFSIEVRRLTVAISQVVDRADSTPVAQPPRARLEEIAKEIVDTWHQDLILATVEKGSKLGQATRALPGLAERIAEALTAAETRGAERLAEIDKFRLSGRNVTFWCTPRAVVTQITNDDEDRSPDMDKSFTSFNEAIEFAIRAAKQQ